MIDVNRLLTSVLASGAPQDAPAGVQFPVVQGGRVPSVPQAGRPADGGGLGGMLGGHLGSLGAGALAGGLAGTLLTSKHTRKLAGTALQFGAAAVLGGLAYKAYQNYRSGQPIVPQSVADVLGGLGSQQAAPQPQPVQAARPGHGYEGFLSRPPQQADGLLLLRSMIAAAMSDGRIDDTERARLIERVEASGFSGEERAYLESLIADPESPARIAADVRAPEVAAQVYLAAHVAIDADTPEERAWLDELARELRLDPALRANIEKATAIAEAQVQTS